MEQAKPPGGTSHLNTRPVAGDDASAARMPHAAAAAEAGAAPLAWPLHDESELNQDRLELALEAAGLDLWENDLVTGAVTRQATKTFTELGYTPEEMASRMPDLFDLVHPDDVEVVRQSVHDHLSGVTPQYRCEFRLRSKQGAWVWFANYGRIMDTHAVIPGRRLIGVTFNIDDRKRREREIADINQQLREQNALLQQLNETLEGLASKDPLTGLCNRRTLMQLGDAECRRAERFGHPLFGGEEFVIVLPETDGPCALKAAESFRSEVAAMSMPVHDQGPRLSVTVSVGVVTGLPGESLNFEALVNRADHALYQAKGTGRNAVYSADGNNLSLFASE
eukprot:gene6286-6146_t